MKFTIQRKQLKALSRFSATKDIRYYLCGIHIVQNARGTYLESTNGHVLGRLLIDETPVDGENSVIIPNDALKILAATGKKGNETLHFTVDGIKITVIQPDDTTMQFSALEGNFPDCDRVVPKLTSDGGMQTSTYNPEYIQAFYDCANDLRGHKSTGISVQIKQRGNDSGIVNIDSEPLFVGIIMPMREQNTVNVPAWCSRPKVKALETESA